ncbi:MAG: ATP-dependent metallopeptidase FtsH/Yme1/Tma family protein [Sphingobacteriia bacterium]|jgi:cell division protease FtsH|nr:ATP-dependent zinc metalloprotease FtsH [Paludibacteraceae bacterium]NCA78962.1 ATP-dependent metallopeptidase FtsH/Yme1/Tma family protein [Sphingobacteriia bacterium]
METKKPISQKQPKPFKPKFNFYWIYLVLLLFFIGSLFWNPENIVREMSYSTFESVLRNGCVDKITVFANTNIVEAKIKPQCADSVFAEKFDKAANIPTAKVRILSADEFSKLISELQQNKIFTGEMVIEEGKDYWDIFLYSVLPFLLIILFFVFMSRRISGGANGGGIFNVGKSKAQLFDKASSDIKISFKDVAGLAGAKQEVEEIVSFLKNPSKYTELGGKIPKGALLVGPPGTGKTLLAKAVAGEANVPFFSMSGSDFVEMFVGVGASRVRDLFKQAKEKAPCIVFIDEIDAVGRARGRNVNMGGNDERENTLNQLLTEMDGFGSNSGVIILAATNRADILDKALLRAGRFDRQIHVELPDVHERKEIFQVHIRPLKMDDSVDIDFLARQTPGFSGADIANVCNEAALIAARKNKSTIQKQDFLDAVDRIVGGLEKKTKITTEEEKRSIAYHEAGHATISWKLQYANPLVKVTIVPRGEALGAAWYLPEERQLTNKEHILDEMCATLGGRAAEEVFFHTASTGAINDLERVTKQAYAMVAYYGMSSQLSNLSYYDSSGNSDYGFTKPYSEITAELIDQEAKKIVNEQYERAKSILEANKEGHNALAQVLIDKEVLFADDVEAILGKRPWISRADELLSESKKENQNLSNDVESKSLDTDNNNTLNTENNESKE